MSSDPSSPGSRRNGSFVPVIILTIVAVAAGAAAMWFVTVYRPQQDAQSDTAQRFVRMSGLDRPVVNKLDDRFTDDDKDLLADAPKDAKQLVDPPKLVFCYIASEDPSDYATQWKPFCDHLSKVTGKPVEYREFASSEEQLKALRDGQLHVTGFNSGSVPIAVNLCGYLPVARIPTNEASGTHVEIIVPADSQLQNETELRNQKYTLALTEPNSNSGYKAPMVFLHSKGIDPERDYLIRTTNDHRESIEGIAKHKYYAAAVSADLLAREVAQGKIKTSQYRKMYSSKPFPSAAIGYCYNLSPELAAKVREAILSFDMKGTALETEFSPVSQTKFVEVKYKDDWSLIRDVDDALGRTYVLK